MYYAVECQKPTVMDWCIGLLANLKSHINQCYLGRQKNFGYGSLFCSFFLERVPLMRPRTDIPTPPPREPRMHRWYDMMYRVGGGTVNQAFNEDFFLWLRCQIICIDDYAYAGVDFRGDPDMPMPEGAQFGDIGKTL